MHFQKSLRAIFKECVVHALWTSLGRKRFVKLARSLWMSARLDPDNDSQINGESLLQQGVCREIHVNQQNVIFDVGSNVGQWAGFFISRLGTERQSHIEFHLFEPSSAAFRVLTENVAKVAENVDVRLNQLAVSDFSGPAEFNILSPLSQINSLAALDPNKVKETVRVECVSLDDYCRGKSISAVRFVKVDTEGNDFKVLCGARSLLERGVIQFIQFEYNHRWIAFRCYLKDVFDFIAPLDYALGKITPRGIEFYERWHPELEKFIEGNYLLCRKDKKAIFPVVKWWND